MESVIRYVSDNSLICIALLASIVIPFITHLLDRRTSEKNAKLSRIFEIFEKYISISSVAVVSDFVVVDFYQAHYLAYFYAPDEIKPTMDEFLKNIQKLITLNGFRNKDLDSMLTNELNLIIKELSKITKV